MLETLYSVSIQYHVLLMCRYSKTEASRRGSPYAVELRVEAQSAARAGGLQLTDGLLRNVAAAANVDVGDHRRALGKGRQLWAPRGGRVMAG